MIKVRMTLMAALVLLAQLAEARDTLFLTGAEVSDGDSSYSFVGVLLPLRQQLGNGWHGRLWLDHIRYSYDDGAGTVQASSPGGHVAAGYQRSDAGGGWSLFAGYAYHDTDLDPQQPEAANAGAQSTVLLSGELNQNIGAQWRFSEAAAWEIRPEAWWTRFKMSYGPATGLSHGLYLAGLGGPDYEVFKLGYSADGFNMGSGLRGNIGFGIGTSPGVEDFPFLTAELIWLWR